MRHLLCLSSLLISSALASAQDAPTAHRFPFDAATAAKYQQDYAQTVKLPQKLTDKLGAEYLLIPPGKFVMGTPKDEPGHKDDEPQFEVTLTKAFYLARYETTHKQFAKFVAENKYTTDVEKSGGGNAHDAKSVWEHRPGTSWQKPGYAGDYKPTADQPVVHVSITDALAFCAWLNETAPVKLSGYKTRYALPTEAQWEWACRAGSGTRFWWGEQEDDSGKVANVGDQSLKKMHPDWPRTIMKMDDGYAFIAPVGSYRANAFGLHDMLGNVWEFCGTRYGAYPKEATTDPGDLSKAESYAVRGGGWSNIAEDCRSGMRNADPPHFGHSNLGFRVAIQLEKE
jgi:formylglycine-generating enzyme required for sulfatase activity